MQSRNNSLDSQLRRKRQELRALEAEIVERFLYKKEQEALIAELIEAGNTELMSLNHDILLAQQQLRAVKNETRNCRQDKQLLTDDLEMLKVQIGRFTDPDVSIGIVSIV